MRTIKKYLLEYVPNVVVILFFGMGNMEVSMVVQTIQSVNIR